MVTIARSIGIQLCFLVVIGTINDGASATLPVSRRALLMNDVLRRHYDELIASRQTRNSYGNEEETTKTSTAPEKAKGFLRIHVAPPSQTVVAQYGSLDLHCDVSGSPPPAVYWLKNGQPIRQAPFELEETTNKILESGSLIPKRGLASTKSRLVIDCADSDTEAIYTCVAESLTERIVSSTYVHVEGEAVYNKTACIFKGDSDSFPARIFMWSGTYIDDEGTDAVLLCRAAGNPVPIITWLDREGNPLNRVSSEKYQILDNGDLKVKNLRWKDHMGGYTCIAENPLGRDESQTFLYPVSPNS